MSIHDGMSYHFSLPIFDNETHNRWREKKQRKLLCVCMCVDWWRKTLAKIVARSLLSSHDRSNHKSNNEKKIKAIWQNYLLKSLFLSNGNQTVFQGCFTVFINRIILMFPSSIQNVYESLKYRSISLHFWMKWRASIYCHTKINSGSMFSSFESLFFEICFVWSREKQIYVMLLKLTAAQ